MASLDGFLGRDAVESIADVQNAITSGGSITTTTVTASTLNTNQMTIANDQIQAIGSSTDIIVTTSASGSFKMDNLKVKANTLSSSNTNGDIVLAPNGAGNVVLGTMTFNADQVIGASEDDYVLTYDHASGTIGLEAGGSASPWTTVGSDITYNTGDVKVSNLTLSSEEITQSAGSDLRLTTTAKVRIDNLSFDDKTVKAETGDLTLTCDDTTTKKVFIGSLPFKLDQSVGSGQDGYVLTYDHSTAKILLEPTTGASNWTTTGSDIYRASSVGVGVSSSTINSQLTVADTGASHCAVQITGGVSQSCSVKLSRGAGDWSSAGNETIGMHLDTDSVLFSKLTSPGNNLTGFAGDAMRIDCANSKVGIASYPYGPSTTLQIGSIGSGRTESLRISTNAGVGLADRSIEMGVDSTSSFIQSNDSANAPIELQVKQGTNGNVMTLNTSGNVAIGTATADEKLHVGGNLSLDAYGADGNGIYFRDGYNSGNDPYNVALAVKDWRGGTTTTDGLLMSGYYGIGFMTQSNTYNASNVRMFIDINGNVGVGTITPYAKMHINGAGGVNTNLGTVATPRSYYRYDVNYLTVDYNPWNMANASLYASGHIIGSTWIVSAGSTVFSDRRIKKDIVDVQDDTCLQKLRLIKPKTYKYQDIVAKGNQPVYGFIAQEVAETLEYAVDKIKKAIPNVYKLASVSNDGLVLTFEEPITLETMDTIKLQLKTLVSEEHDVIVSQVLSPTSIRLEEALTEDHHTGTLGEESIVRKVFVYGQWVDDFHVLKKDAIFTVAVSALQEVDRQQQLHKNKISTLEARMALLEQRLNNAGL